MAGFVKGNVVIVPFPFSDLTQVKRRPAVIVATIQGEVLMTDTYDDEKEMLESFERGEWTSVKNVTDEKHRYQMAAQASIKKDKRVNIRLSSHDLEAIQRIAVEEGLPYQTLLSSIIHRYATGRLIPRVREGEN